MYISYDYYRIFYYVAKYGNLSQAAKQLLNNQPNMTRAIKNLEGELGCPLFLRTNRGMKLTPGGRALVRPRAHRVRAYRSRRSGDHREPHAANRHRVRRRKRGRAALPAAAVLKEFRLLHPGIHIRISNHSTPQAIAALKEGTADIAVVTTPTAPSASLTETPVRPIHEYAVCSPFFETLTNRQVKLEELLEFPLISLGADTKSFEFYSGFFAAHGLPYHPGYRSVHRRPNFAHGRSRPRHRVRAGRILGKMVKCLSHRFGRENTGKKRRRHQTERPTPERRRQRARKMILAAEK